MQYEPAQDGTSRRWWDPKSRGPKRTLAAVSAVACAGLLAAGCGSRSTGNSSAPATGGGSSMSTATPFGAAEAWNETWSANKYNTNYYGGLANYWALLPLGFPQKTANRVTMFNIIPQMMQGADFGPHNRVTVHLRPGAKFSDGSPVNAKDVYDSMLLQAVDQDFTFENDVQSISTPNATTVVVQFRPSTANVNVRGWITNTTPVPMSVYGRFIVPGLAKAAFGFNSLIAKEGQTKAQQSPDYKLLNNDLQKLLKFEPKKFVGDGPFNLQRVTTAQAELVKSPTFFDASQVHIPSVSITNSSTTSNIFPMLFGQKLDFYPAVETSANILARWKSTPNAHTLTFPNDITEEILFNNKKYPFTLLPVRQAVAHVINRPKLVSTEVGGTSVNRPAKYPDGLTQLLNNIWLSPSQLRAMNPYGYDPAKATALLESAGFKKVGSTWRMPNGKPFTTQVLANSVPSTSIVAAKEVASELSQFGIRATASAIQSAGYATQIQKGGFQLAWQTGVGTNLEPLCGIATGGLGEPNNYTFTGSNGAVVQGQAGIGFGPKARIPGVGNVAVSAAIDTQCQNTPSGPKMASLANSWAGVVNRQMPYLTYADDYQVDRYSTSHYTDWPSAGSAMWSETGIYPVQGFVWMLEHGYVRPR